MANKIINKKEITKEQAQQLFDTFSTMLKKHQVKINSYAQELDMLKTAITKQAFVYSNVRNNYKKETVLNTIYTTQKQAQTIQQGIEEFYKKGLQYYYNIRAEFTGEQITDTVYIQLKDKDSTKWVRAKNIPFETLMTIAEPSFHMTQEQKEQEQDFYHLKAQLNVSYKNLLSELDKIGYDYKSSEDVSLEVEKGLKIQEKYNKKNKNLSRQDKINVGNIVEGIERVKQNSSRYNDKLTVQNIIQAKKNWLSGLLGGDVGTVQVKGLSIGKSFQIITLNNITSKFKKLAKKLNEMTNKGVSLKRIEQFLSLFYSDYYNRIDETIEQKIKKDIEDIIGLNKKKK